MPPDPATLQRPLPAQSLHFFATQQCTDWAQTGSSPRAQRMASGSTASASQPFCSTTSDACDLNLAPTRHLIRRNSRLPAALVHTTDTMRGISPCETAQQFTTPRALRRRGVFPGPDRAAAGQACIPAPLVILSTTRRSACSASPAIFRPAAANSATTARLAASWPVVNISSV